MEAFKSQALYFVGTPLEKYLSGVMAKITGDVEGQGEIIRRLNEKLDKIECVREVL